MLRTETVTKDGNEKIIVHLPKMLVVAMIAPDSSTTGFAPQTWGHFPSVETKAVDFLGTSNRKITGGPGGNRTPIS